MAFGVTPADRANAEFHSAAAQIILVLLLVLAIEGQVFRWQMARASLSTATREDVVSDDRFLRFAAGEGPVSDAVEAVLDATFDAARTSPMRSCARRRRCCCSPACSSAR